MEVKPKLEYIENASPGTIIAFVDENGKARSAAIVNRSSKNKLLKVETEFKREFIVPYENVLWVKNGSRFPRGVYNMLKGIKSEEEKNIAEQTNSK